MAHHILRVLFFVRDVVDLEEYASSADHTVMTYQRLLGNPF